MRRKPKRTTAPEYIVAHYDELKERLHDQETKFDNAVLLVGGGAFTVSAAIVAALKQPLESSAVLAVAWTAWALCLLLIIVSYLFSVKATCIILDLIDDGIYDAEKLSGGWRAKIIPGMNRASFLCLFVGFAGFGFFLFTNVTGGTHEHTAQEGKAISEEAGQQEEGGAKTGNAYRPTSVQPAAPSTVSKVGEQHDRQEPRAAATAR
jgi:hypothetical protein